MPNPTVVGFSRNFTRPSKTRGFVEHVVRDIAARNNLSASTYDIEDVGASLGSAKWGPAGRKVGGFWPALCWH